MGFKLLRRSVYHSPLSDCRRHHCLLTAFLLLCRDMASESFQVFLCQFMRVDTEYGISFPMCLRHTTCSVKTFLLCIVFDKRVEAASPISLQLTLHASCSLHTPGCSAKLYHFWIPHKDLTAFVLLQQSLEASCRAINLNNIPDNLQ